MKIEKIDHLDSSIVIPYISALLGMPAKDAGGVAKQKRAVAFMDQLHVPARISVATYAEVMRHFPDDAEAHEILLEFRAPMQLTQRHARRWARLQNRSARVMGDNDAWNAALAIDENATLVGSDHAFEKRPDLDYIDFMKAGC